MPNGAKKGKQIDKGWWGTTSGISLGAFNVVQLFPYPHTFAFQVIDAGAELRKANTQAMLKCQCLVSRVWFRCGSTSTFHLLVVSIFEAPMDEAELCRVQRRLADLERRYLPMMMLISPWFHHHVFSFWFFLFFFFFLLLLLLLLSLLSLLSSSAADLRDASESYAARCCAVRIRGRSDSADSALGPKLLHAAWMQNEDFAWQCDKQIGESYFGHGIWCFLHLHPWSEVNKWIKAEAEQQKVNLAAGKTKAPFYTLKRLVVRRLRMCDGCSENFKLAGLPTVDGMRVDDMARMAKTSLS